METKSFKLGTGASLNKFIDHLERSNKRLNDDFQLAAVHCIGHAFEHGDKCYADRLINAMSKTINKQAMSKYLETHGPLLWVAKAKAFAYVKRDNLVFDGAELMKKPWYDGIKDPDITSIYDVQKAVDLLVKKVEKLILADAGSVKHAELIDEIKAANGKYTASLYVDDSSTGWDIPGDTLDNPPGNIPQQEPSK
jgi:hypothetical protein